MSLINKILDDLRQERSQHPAAPGILSSLKQGCRQNLVLICLCLTITFLLVLFGGGKSASEKSPAPAPAPAGADAGSRPSGERLAPPPPERAVAVAANPPGSSLSLRKEDLSGALASARPVAALSRQELAAMAPPAGQPREVPAVAPGRPAPAGEPVESALTREEALYAPVYSYRSAAQAYAAGQRAFVVDGNSEVAVDYLRQALQLDPGHLAARELLAEILYKVLRRDKDAIAVLQAGVARAPAHAAFTRKLAKILAERGDYAAAARVLLSHGLPNIRADREALEDLAGLYGKLDEPYLAAQTYRYLLAEYPTHGRYWVSLGAAQERQQLPEEAMASYQKAMDTGNLGRELADQARGRLDALRRRAP